MKDQVMRCECGGPIKPDITFFGEQLPKSFLDSMVLCKEADLLIVLGTALAVNPFKSLVSMVGKDVPKVLFNMENVFETSGYDFTKAKEMKCFVKGKCDESIRKLVADCGWQKEFEDVLPACHKGKQ